jgi:chromosome segregation ATPase
MLVEVQQTDSPKTIQRFLDEVTKMMTKLQDEQAKHQEISDKMFQQCTDEDAFRAKEVAVAADAFTRATDAEAKCQASLDSANEDLPELQSALQTYQNELAAAIAQRAAEHDTYSQRKADYEEAIAFLKDFQAYLQDQAPEFNQASFVEKSEKLLRHATKLGLLAHAVPVLVALASRQDVPEVPTTHNNYNYASNQDLGAKLNDALNTLLTKLQSDWQVNEDTEVSAQGAFNTLQTQLQAAIATLEDNIDRTQDQITAMNKCVVDEDAVAQSASAKLNRNQSLQDSANQMCNQFATEFIDATNSRLDEIKSINEILAIIEKRFGELPADLKTYLASVEDGWTAYENSTAFQKFYDYQQQHTADDAHGADLNSGSNILSY